MCTSEEGLSQYADGHCEALEWLINESHGIAITVRLDNAGLYLWTKIATDDATRLD